MPKESYTGSLFINDTIDINTKILLQYTKISLKLLKRPVGTDW